jgi:hypothetical protein
MISLLSLEILPRTLVYPDWIILVLLSSLIMLAYVNFNYSGKIRRLFKAGVNLNIARQFIREEYSLSNRTTILLLINFFVVLAVFLFPLRHFNNYESFSEGLSVVSFENFIAHFGIIALVFAGKIILIKISGVLFDSQRAADEYSYHIILYSSIMGIILYPFVILSIFTLDYSFHSIIITTIILISLVYIALIIKGLIICVENKLFTIHLFLYICSLEILPLIIAAKTLSLN